MQELRERSNHLCFLIPETNIKTFIYEDVLEILTYGLKLSFLAV